MPRTKTSDRSSFIIPGIGGMYFPNPTGSSPLNQVRISMLPGDHTGIHWHETHAELLQVLQGVGMFYLNGRISVCTPRSEPIVVGKSVRHGYWRADRDLSFAEDGGKGGKLEGLGVTEEELAEEFVVLEWTDPVDGDKEVFFRQGLSLLEEWEREKEMGFLRGLISGFWTLWSMLVVMAGHDHYLVFVDWERWLGRILGKSVCRGMESCVAHGIEGLVGWLGTWVGLKRTYDEYTPEALRNFSKERRE